MQPSREESAIEVAKYYEFATQRANSKAGFCGNAIFLDWIHDDISKEPDFGNYDMSQKEDDMLFRTFEYDPNLADKIKFLAIIGSPPKDMWDGWTTGKLQGTMDAPGPWDINFRGIFQGRQIHKIDDNDNPINAANTQNTVCAFAALILLIPKLI